MIRFEYDNTLQRGVLRRSTGTNIDTDAGLVSSTHASLLSNALAAPGDPVPHGHDRQGWALDGLGPDGPIGSKLWLLMGGKLPPSALLRAQRWAVEALQWLIDDGVAERVEAVAEQVAPGVLGLDVRVLVPDVPASRWVDMWFAITMEGR